MKRATNQYACINTHVNSNFLQFISSNLILNSFQITILFINTFTNIPSPPVTPAFQSLESGYIFRTIVLQGPELSLLLRSLWSVPQTGHICEDKSIQLNFGPSNYSIFDWKKGNTATFEKSKVVEVVLVVVEGKKRGSTRMDSLFLGKKR